MIPSLLVDDDGGFGAELVLLVLLALGDAVDVRLVQGVNLARVLRLLGEHLPVQGQVPGHRLNHGMRRPRRTPRAVAYSDHDILSLLRNIGYQ